LKLRLQNKYTKTGAVVTLLRAKTAIIVYGGGKEKVLDILKVRRIKVVALD
jgi:hypothetical protein